MLNKDISLVADAVAKVLAGDELSEETLYALADIDSDEGRAAIIDGAAKITERFCSRKFDFCSIINARSGRCPENCKWCAQSAHYNTGCEVYEQVSDEDTLALAEANADHGVGRFSLVTSGRLAKGFALDGFCRQIKEINRRGRISTCASLGLLGREELMQLREAGVRRYHCNLETAASFFPSLCSTHSREEKLAAIARARRAGMEICSGGIIGMGETMRQRVEFALELREVNPVSIPLNVLQPIPGTPLEHMPPLTDTEILDTVAIFRLVHPRVIIRFAGGRARISPHAQREALRIGVNGAIMGDLLTTIGAQIEQHKTMIKECGYDF